MTETNPWRVPDPPERAERERELSGMSRADLVAMLERGWRKPDGKIRRAVKRWKVPADWDKNRLVSEILSEEFPAKIRLQIPIEVPDGLLPEGGRAFKCQCGAVLLVIPGQPSELRSHRCGFTDPPMLGFEGR